MGVIEEFTKHGNMASFHYADDSGSEWGAGNREKNAAMELYRNNPLLQSEMREIACGFLWSLEREL